MNHLHRLAVLFLTFALCLTAAAQQGKWREMYKVKKKDTAFSIAKKYGITMPELIAANPDMSEEGYKLKKDDFLFIPYPKQAPAKPAAPSAAGIRDRAIRIGVMLPLHKDNGDGLRMTEYYRGLLMACDSLRAAGIATDIHAWNVPEQADIHHTVLEAGAKDCDIIFGPLYTAQLPALQQFCAAFGIRLVVPFSISGNPAETARGVWQVYQTQSDLTRAAADAFVERFPGAHPVFIDCNDSTSRKGTFTALLRRKLEAVAVRYNITSLRTDDDAFAKAFDAKRLNVVVLNTARSPQLNATFARLNALTKRFPGVKIALWGYTEWLMYTKVYAQLFHRYDTYIPTTFFYNPASARVRSLEESYRRWFGTPMQDALPRFALTGYDHAQYFVRGLRAWGSDFRGDKQQTPWRPVQTTLHFRQQDGKGWKNAAFMLAHYTTTGGIEAINY